MAHEVWENCLYLSFSCCRATCYFGGLVCRVSVDIQAIIYSNCQNVIDLINNEHFDLYINVLNNYRLWLKRLSTTQIKYCNRKFNQVADRLTKFIGANYKKKRFIGALESVYNVIRIFPYPLIICIKLLDSDWYICNSIN